MHEINGEKHNHYRSFSTLQPNEYQQESYKFLESGCFDSTIGNLMPLAMCNVISANFAIFRSHQPPLYISTENALNNGTIFLVYYKDGKGYYAGVSHHSISANASNPVTKKQQSNAVVVLIMLKSSATSCDPQLETMYKCRCPCLKNNSTCSHLCRCVGCKIHMARERKKKN